mmetsp:Transcript_13798/g.59019  ORF Transcript_13798/g.59019 Transcript_13798/m.59019 type:complete len:288 (+) Transcript_13798:767-1630(+)
MAKRRRAFAVFAKRKTRILVGGEGRRRELRRPRGFRRRVFTRRRVFETRRRRRRRRRRDDDEDEDEDDVRGGRRRDVSFLRLDLGRRRRVHARRRAERADDDAARARRRRRRGPPRVGRSRRARPRATHGDGDSRNEKVPERLFWGKKKSRRPRPPAAWKGTPRLPSLRSASHACPCVCASIEEPRRSWRRSSTRLTTRTKRRTKTKTRTRTKTNESDSTKTKTYAKILPRLIRLRRDEDKALWTTTRISAKWTCTCRACVSTTPCAVSTPPRRWTRFEAARAPLRV